MNSRALPKNENLYRFVYWSFGLLLTAILVMLFMPFLYLNPMTAGYSWFSGVIGLCLVSLFVAAKSPRLMEAKLCIYGALKTILLAYLMILFIG